MPDGKSKEELELFHAYLRQNGLKKTHQKDLILETFIGTEGHLSVEDMYALVKKKDKKIGIVTVFRTLKSLTNCGISREITLDDGLTRFEHNYHHPHHHHIVCTECHKAIEFLSPELERIQSEIVSKYHFQPVHHRFQIHGVCEDCHAQTGASEVQKHDTEKIFARDALRMAIVMAKHSIDFYRAGASRTVDPQAQRVLEQIEGEENRHLGELEAELDLISRQEKGLEHAPMFLHFNASDLQQLVPDFKEFEVDGQSPMDTRKVLEVAMAFEHEAAEFFRSFAEKFADTEGKRIFQSYADVEMRHYEMISRRMEEMMAPA